MATPNFRIRSATPDDAAACLAIYTPIVRDTVISFEFEPPSLDEMRSRIESILPHKPWLVAEIDGGVAAYAYGSSFRARAAYQWTIETTIYVDPAHHGRGIGRRLYAALLGVLAHQGYKVAIAGISVPNPQSVGFHEAMGFRAVGIFAAVGHKHGAWRDTGFWSRELGPGCAPAPPRSAAECPNIVYTNF